MADILFVLGDILPTYYDVAIAIFSYAVKVNSTKMKDTIRSYSKSLIEVWGKAFGPSHVLTIKSVVSKVEKLVTHYHNNVYSVYTRKSAKHKGETFQPMTLRTLNHQWKSTSIEYRCVGVFPISGLFDIGSNMEDLEGLEKVFYHDQKSARICRLSEEVDEDWVKEQLLLMEKQKDVDVVAINVDYDFDVELDVEAEGSNSLTDSFTTRSGKIRKAVEEVGCQTEVDFSFVPAPKIRKNRNCSEEVKSACVQVSVECGISTALATKAVQIVCSVLYGHQYYLTKEEAIKKDPSLISYRENADPDPIFPLKKQRLSLNSEKKRIPISMADYIPYQKVLPAPRTLNDHKQLCAIQEESDAANALFNIADNVRCCLHYDTTSRCKIDGEWPAIIFSFSDKQRYTLRPLYFAYEDRSQIVKLLVETFERLSLLVTTDPADMNVTGKYLWEKLSIIMTDSVEKNLKIEEGIATALNSSHHPIHLLCKAHTVEALDRSNIDVLAKMENALKFREALESQNPNLKSFLRGEKSVALCAIKSITSFVSHDKSASSTNQAELFDYVLQREGKYKHLSLYKERRFTKLGYTCASILDALPYIQMVLNESHLTNQHTDIVQLFVDSELLLTELHCLAYFTSKVSLPLLYAVEICNQDDLCAIFPKLYHDLLNNNLETLSEYYIEYRHVPVYAPSSAVEIQIIKDMCIDAAKVIERQCGREYGFGKLAENQIDVPRATQVFKLSQSLRKDINVTNNVVAECHLSIFDRKSVVSKFRNYKFKAKSIRNDLVLHHSSFKNSPSPLLKKIARVVNEREESWTETQKIMHQNKTEEKLVKAKNHSKYVHKLLVQCKGWGGPVLSIDELHSILKKKPDIAEKIVRVELGYYKHTHRSDVIATPSLFQLNNVHHCERLSNLCILLSGQSKSFITLPDNNDALQILRTVSDEKPTHEESKLLDIGQMCVTLWDVNGHQTWYLGYCIENSQKEGLYTVEHIHRTSNNSNLKWKYPTKNDISEVDVEQILKCVIDGEWNITRRNNEFTLKNHNDIDVIFKEALPV